MKFFAVLAAIALASSTVNANERDDAELFFGVCIMNAQSPERVVSTAKLGQWKELAKEFEPMVQASEGKLVGAWQFKEKGKMYLAATSLTKMDGVSHHACALVVNNSDPEKIIAEIRAQTRGSAIRTSREDFQIYRFFDADVASVGKMLITVTSAQNPELKVVRLAILKRMAK